MRRILSGVADSCRVRSSTLKQSYPGFSQGRLMVGSERLGRMEAQADAPGFRGPGPAAGAKDMRLVQENSFGFLGMARIPSGRSNGGRRCVDRRPLALRENGSANLLFPLFCLEIWAVAVINDLRLVDCVSVSVRSVKAGLLSFCARNVFNPPT